MQLVRDGAELRPAPLCAAELAAIEVALSAIPAHRPGTRLASDPALSARLAAAGTIGRIAADHLGPDARPVRAILFNKSAAANWSLGWHQDRTIAVRGRIDTPAFSNWTIKSGVQHVEPPFALLERMLTLRAHLDTAGPDNAPLLISPGTHRLGRVPEAHIPRIVAHHGTHACIAARGDVWLYATPILLASDAARAPAARRVLHVDYSADALPGGLAWLAV